MPLSPEEKERIYEEEKERQAAQDKLKKEASAKAGKNLGIGCVVIIGVIILISLISSLKKGTGPNPTSLSKKQTEKAASPSMPSIGDKVTLAGTADKVMLGVSKSDYDEMIRASVAKDYLGLAKMEASGRLFLVNNRTRALLLDSTYGTRQVRILEGGAFGRSGWVSKENIQP